MNDYGIWSLIISFITIIIAMVTRQVILSLIVSIIIGYTVISHGNFFLGIDKFLKEIINIFKSENNTKTILFILSVGGIIRLITITGGIKSLVIFLTKQTNFIKNKQSIQILAMLISMVIFLESSINQLIAGASTKHIARYYGISAEKMAYIIQSSSISICSSVIINGWGATMMGIINTQISLGIISGEPFQILINSIIYNVMAWLTLITVLFYIFTDFSWGPMKLSEQKALSVKNRLYKKPSTINQDIINHSANNSLLNFFIPIITTIIMIPISLYITGHGDFTKGNSSTSVYWAVMFSTFISFIWFLTTRILTVESFLKEIYIGYGSMIKVCLIMILAFLMGDILNKLNTGAYIAQISYNILPSGLSAAFVFLISSIISLAIGTSWGTCAIMIPIGIQLGLSVKIPIELMIGAVIAGSIFGDMTSPISSDAIIASIATECNHIKHIKTQMPYIIVTAFITLIIYIYLGFKFTKS